MTYTPPKFCMRCDDPVSLCCCPNHPPDIMEKARELAKDAHHLFIVCGLPVEETLDIFAAALAGARQDEIEQLKAMLDNALIHNRLAEARAVPDIEASDYLRIASNADRMMRIWQLNNPHAKSNSWLENDIGYWICKISLDKQNAVPDGWQYFVGHRTSYWVERWENRTTDMCKKWETTEFGTFYGFIREVQKDAFQRGQAFSSKVPQWLPIESAPKNEMFIWGYRKREKFLIGLAYQTVSNTWRDAYGDPNAKGATHWMSLPAAPNPPIAGGEG